MKYHIEPATPDQAPSIAPLIMMAMDEDCCQHFPGPTTRWTSSDR